MIQRIQSVWLFLASILNSLLFLFPLYSYTRRAGGSMILPNIATERIHEGARNHMPLFLIAAVITLLPLAAIFLFRNRKQQRGMVVLCIISVISFVSVTLMRVGNLRNGTAAVGDFEYAIPGLILPVAGIVFLFLALAGIRKDDKLIKSLDRLR